MIEMARRTKIVSTIGPASSSRETLRELVAAGADKFRLNFSHGVREEHAQVIKWLREIADEDDKPISILQDLQGPKIRVGNLDGGSIRISAGDVITLTSGDIIGNYKMIPIDFEELPSVLDVGRHIMMDDGHLELVVTSIAFIDRQG
jgi:pyruvate kinase